MPRPISPSFRRATEAPATGVVPLVFLRLDHPRLMEPVRVVSDVADHLYQGARWLGGFPFEAEIVSDDEQPPRARLRIQNVDRRVGLALRALPTPPEVEAIVLASDDFGAPEPVDGIATRVAQGTPIIQYRARRLRLREVEGDAVAIEGALAAWDPTGEPYPAIRATPDILPGLFR